jgi:hypothetical protein
MQRMTPVFHNQWVSLRISWIRASDDESKRLVRPPERALCSAALFTCTAQLGLHLIMALVSPELPRMETVIGVGNLFREVTENEISLGPDRRRGPQPLRRLPCEADILFQEATENDIAQGPDERNSQAWRRLPSADSCVRSLKRFVPAIEWLSTYKREYLRPDLLGPPPPLSPPCFRQ